MVMKDLSIDNHNEDQQLKNDIIYDAYKDQIAEDYEKEQNIMEEQRGLIEEILTEFSVYNDGIKKLIEKYDKEMKSIFNRTKYIDEDTTMPFINKRGER